MAKCCVKTKFSSLTVIIFLITVLNADAQLNPAVGASSWKYVNPFQHGYSMNDMSFIDDNNGLAVGGNGAIAKTTDGGLNWQYLSFKWINSANTVALAQLQDVHFVTPAIAYAVGSSGVMIKSTDAGLTWTQINTPLTPLGRNINALHFLNKDTGYIGGAAILSTNTTTAVNINEIPKVYFTRNGGATWDSLVTPFRARQYNTTLPTPNPVLSGFTTAEIQRIVFLNDSVGYIAGSCGQSVPQYSAILWKFEKGVLKDYSIHRTKFGISLFSGTGSSHTPSTSTFKGLLPINDSLVLISANTNGIVVRVKTGKNDSTANAVPVIYGAYEKGVYEVVAQVNTAPPFPANSPLNTGSMWHIKKAPGGKIVMSNGRSIAFSTDNGTSWTTTNPIPATSNIAHWQFNAMDVTPNGRIVAGGYNGITYDSLPGSSAWRTQYKNVRPLFYSFSDMDWADCNNGIMVGNTGTIVKTTDGGKNWVNISNPIFEASDIGMTNVFYPAVNSMFFSTNSFGYITINKSTDQGASYTPIFTEPNPNSGGLPSFTMSGQRAWAVGYRFSPETQRTMIFRTLNANATTPVWDTVKTFPLGSLAPQLQFIRFANQDTGYVTGNRGKVYRTIDGGTNWTDISPDTLATVNGTLNSTATYTGLSVINGKTLYIGGSRTRLFKSTDAGVTWTNLSPVPTTSPITFNIVNNIGGPGTNGILMNDENSGYISLGAFFLKTTDGWATWTYDMAPQGLQTMSLYPKIAGPLQNKKLYWMTQTVGFGGPISTSTAALLEYGNASLINVSSSETLTTTCNNVAQGSIVINATGGIAPYSYSINGGAFQVSNTFTGLTPGSKNITIKDAGCQSITKTVTIGVKPAPAVNAGPDFTIVDGDQVVLQGSSTGTPTSLAWTPNTTLTGATTFIPTAKPSATTTYILTVTDANGCVSTDNAIVTVLPYCLKVMDAFTPNGDGQNDRWLVTNNGGACTKRVYVTVFNRYGSIIYKNDNYQNTWDGTYDGRPVADGTYYYTINYVTITDNTLRLQGNVTILR